MGSPKSQNVIVASLVWPGGSAGNAILAIPDDIVAGGGNVAEAAGHVAQGMDQLPGSVPPGRDGHHHPGRPLGRRHHARALVGLGGVLQRLRRLAEARARSPGPASPAPSLGGLVDVAAVLVAPVGTLAAR